MMLKVTKEQGIEYVRAWGEERTGENVAFYMNAIEFLVARYAPKMLLAGNGIAAVQRLMERAALPSAPSTTFSSGSENAEGPCGRG